MKAAQNEIKQNIQGTNSEGKETGSQINNFEQEEELDSQPEQNEETRIQKMRRRLGNSGITLSTPTPELQGCQKEESKSMKLKTYLKK